MDFPKVTLYGIPVSKMNMHETVGYLTEAIKQGKSHQVVTANPTMFMAGLENPDFMNALKNAELIVPDGAGLVWAAGYVGRPVAERVTGFDLMHELLRVGETYRWRVYLLGASADVVKQAAANIAQRFPLIQIVGYRDGFFGEADDEGVITAVREAKPDLLFVARSLYTQEPWIARYKERLNVPVMMGVGGSLDIISGKLKRAPHIFRRLRLEWLYRLLQEPSRFGRMLVLPKFALKVIREKEKVLKS